MQLTICEKHKKKEKPGVRLLSGSSVCVNRYCPNAYTIICAQCKNDHRDHSIKILTLEDINQFIKRLLKAPFTLNNKYITQSIDIMKKIKLIKEFRRKIDILETDMVKEAVKLIDLTQTVIEQYAVSRKAVTQLADKLQQMGEPQVYNNFKISCQEYLSQIDYNFKKQKMQFGNSIIKEKQEKRRKILDVTKRRIEEVKDYSMKIIEVILNNQDSEEEQIYQDQINHKKKYYQSLKEQLNFQPNREEEEQTNDQDKDQDLEEISNQLLVKQQKLKQCIDFQIQTDNQWLNQLNQQVQIAKKQLNTEKINTERILNQYKDQIKLLIKDKQILKSEIIALKCLIETERKTIKTFHQRLTQTQIKNRQISTQKQDVLRKIIQLQNR